ncbi:DUF2786 domain-containing protein [Cyanobium sp. Aljojuca 7D2]|uniref:DUF2786 domain-containing protein n=1 Tax=Cyanobium sp. Aljojuca 7D2 TaxID=2823698 RepID=UPI0020CF567A|nr:DUF2786 domain-containing protein [Cyanobium sp. Aljojuca 7D2]MCP9891670.1 DUF2786 domain-containing protein [Cyanobium sp. Aljojuca 7D2]
MVDSAAAADRAAEKVRKLVAMSASPHLEEARTSAFLACRLIREHGLQVAPHCLAAQPMPAQPHRPAGGQTPGETSGFRRIRVRHPGHCRCCGSPIAPGEWALWCRGNGLRHPLCSP